MGKSILGVVAGLVAWIATATLAGLILRVSWPAYASVATTPTSFTLPMLLVRLAIGAIATVVTGLVATLVARRSPRVRWIPGLILLALFVPEHVSVWSEFPVWYHLAFLTSLVPLTWAGGAVGVSRVHARRSS
jgi:hypothetical protein